MPKIMPTAPLIPKANTSEMPVITVGVWPKRVTRNGIRDPRLMPRTPPRKVSMRVSVRN